MLIVLGIIIMVVAILLLYLKYRVVIGSEKYQARIVDVVSSDAGYVVGGVRVKKRTFVVKVGNRKYYTAHGCLCEKLGKRQIGKEISVYINEKYGREVFKCNDYRVEILSVLLVAFSIILISAGV